MTQIRRKCIHMSKKHSDRYSREYFRENAKREGKDDWRCPLCDPEGKQRMKYGR